MKESIDVSCLISRGTLFNKIGAAIENARSPIVFFNSYSTRPNSHLHVYQLCTCCAREEKPPLGTIYLTGLLQNSESIGALLCHRFFWRLPVCPLPRRLNYKNINNSLEGSRIAYLIRNKLSSRAYFAFHRMFSIFCLRYIFGIGIYLSLIHI